MSDQSLKIRRALVSVSDKTGLTDLAAALAGLEVEIISTGGTARTIAEAGIAVTDVSEVTGFPEMLGGRVKTLHPNVHGGLLADRSDPEHMAALEGAGIGTIDLLVSNLYPFERTVASGAGFREVIENIDIGGPAMTRAAAKNHEGVAVVVDPADYPALVEAMRTNGGAVPRPMLRRLAAKAFARTAEYDAAISAYLAAETGEELPETLSVSGRRGELLRYGENPHQRAGFYRSARWTRQGVGTARQVQGKPLSYNNILDTDAAFEAVAEFRPDEGAAVVIVKHANPCGVATGDTLEEAYRLALRTDPVSAFGGIVALNRPLDELAARAITEIFTEVVIAPGASDAALQVMAAKGNLRLLLTDGLPDPAAPGLAMRTVAGGFLAQSRDSGRTAFDEMRVVTKRAPTQSEMTDMIFAWRVAKHVKSNAVVYVREGATAGIGAGQMSRVDSSRIAARKAEDAAQAAGLEAPLTKGSVVASDAFFPFADGLVAAIEAGATAVIQPGGSVRDDEVIAAADAHGVAMAFTGMRHFRH